MNENCDNNEPRNRTKYTYDNANNVFTVAYPNSVTTTYGYDQLNRVSGLGYTTQTGVYTYQRDNAGNLTNASEPSGRQLVWNYDGINRVTQETISSAPSGKNGNLAYGLDPVGNRTSATSISGLAPISGTFDLDDQLSSEGYSDRNGNVTSAVTAAGSKTFTYDSENHLISMGGTVSMLYDGDGNRVKKTTSSGATMYLVDDLNPTGYPQVVEELTNGAASRTYTYGLQRISQYQPINGTPSFYQYDGGGNVRQLTIITGAVTDQYEYDAFGNEFTVSGGSNTPNEFMYRGEQYDSDLGLYYLRARYYNPLTGRFMSRDPEDGNTADPNTLHKYLYANGDPVNMEDPTGHAAYIESIFTRTLVSSPLELGAEYVGLTVGAELCAYAKFVVQATTGWPSNLQSSAGVPLWSLKALAIICSATGF